MSDPRVNVVLYFCDLNYISSELKSAGMRHFLEIILEELTSLYCPKALSDVGNSNNINFTVLLYS